jgi:glycosyltransferase involved in cell wall biosynthesis
MLSLIAPSYNNLQHLKNLYASVCKHAPEIELILIDDASEDDTWLYLNSIAKENPNLLIYRSPTRQGHTILYDKGINMAKHDIIGILHADMMIGPNYVENMVKHLTPGVVVSATRIEPPIHPPGNEKIIMDFGVDFDTWDPTSFESFCLEKQSEFKDKTTNGVFAPWILYKNDFQAIGGHDPKFAPYGYEDSDIFNRWILNGYKMVQSRDAFVYHLTCRGHRWNKGIGIDNSDYKETMESKRKEYLRKWGSWVQNDESQHPIIPPVYKKKFIITPPNPFLEEILEPWFNNGEDIIVEINSINFTQNDFQIVTQLNAIIKDSGEIGQFSLGNLKITINSLQEYQKDLIKV